MNKELFDSNAAMYVLGYIMQEPKTLTSEKYMLNIDDFTKPLYKIVFGALFNLASDGAQKIHPQDVDLFVAQYGEQYRRFTEDNGLTFLEQLDHLELGYDEAIFNKHYERLKKFTVLRQLQKDGIDTTEFYNPNVDIFQIDAENEKLNRLTTSEILDKVRLKVAKIEKKNVNKTDVYFQNAAKGLRQLVAELKQNPEVGPSLEGDMTNFITRGARYGKSYLISMPSGGGKTRYMVGNMCRFAFPRLEGNKVVFNGELHKVLYIATEQLPDEIQTLILSYVSGVSEEKILYNTTTPAEEERIELALQIIEKYQDNLVIDVIQTPTISTVRSKILEPILDRGIDMVCYDYIFIPTDDDGSSFSHQYRTDQILMMLSNQLKEIAAAYNVFLLSATQLNGTWEDKMVRNQNMLRDSKAIADKADIGMIAVKCTDEEFNMVAPFFEQLSITKRPNQVIDIYKNRRGSVVNAKIFRYFDYGTCRAEDLLVTTQNFKLLEDATKGRIQYQETRSVDILDFFNGGEF